MRIRFLMSVLSSFWQPACAFRYCLAPAGRSSGFFSPAPKSKTGISSAGLPKSVLLATRLHFSCLAAAPTRSRFLQTARSSQRAGLILPFFQNLSLVNRAPALFGSHQFFCFNVSCSSCVKTRERVKNRFPSGPSRENIPPRPSTTSIMSCVCFQYSYWSLEM